MKIKNYTVVSCPNCEEVWIVEDMPEQSKCPRCDKTRKFKLLKKYRSFEDIEKARLVRAKVKASLSGEDEKFDEALEEEEIIAGDDAFSTGTRFTGNSESKSFEDIVTEAIEEYESREEIIDYCEKHGYGEERVIEYIEKKERNGELIESEDNIRFL